MYAWACVCTHALTHMHQQACIDMHVCGRAPCVATMAVVTSLSLCNLGSKHPACLHTHTHAYAEVYTHLYAQLRRVNMAWQLKNFRLHPGYFQTIFKLFSGFLDDNSSRTYCTKWNKNSDWGALKGGMRTKLRGTCVDMRVDMHHETCTTTTSCVGVSPIMRVHLRCQKRN